MKPPKPIRRVSVARSKQLREYAKVKREFLSHIPTCDMCCKLLAMQDRELHHAYGRSGKLLCWVPGFRCLCRGCHVAIHILPEMAIERGFLGPMGTFNDFTRAQKHYESLTK